MKLAKLLHRHRSLNQESLDKFEFRLPNIMSGKKALMMMGSAVLFVLIIFGFILLVKYIMNLSVYQALENTQSFTPKQIGSNQQLSAVNNVIELPTDQNGTIGKIKDVKALTQKKDYFKKARNGDILIIYPDMTIIYDPANNSVVDIAKTNLLQ